MTYELHPLCVLFPRMAGPEFDSLRDDIRAHGLRSPIVLHDGMILDGGNRYRACIEAGVEPHFENFEGDNLVSFVLSSNLHRRHMSAGQQAAIVATATDWAKAQTVGRPGNAEGLPHLSTVAHRAATAGTTERTQREADKLVREHPAEAAKVTKGEKSLYRAVQDTKPAKTAKQVEAEQAAADAHSDFDPIKELEETQAEVIKLQGEIAAAEADDQKAESIKWKRLHMNAERRQSELMDAANSAQKHTKFLKSQLDRCGRAVGESDPDKIAPTVEAFVRKHTKVAA